MKLLDHEEYLDKTIKIREKAYAPYSKFLVGALVVDENGMVYSGVNVENSSYGLTSCAERNAIAGYIAQGGNPKKIKRLYIVGSSELPTPPCGACRQVMIEFFDNDVEIIFSGSAGNFKVVNIEELVPHHFSGKLL
jgi:cytidine deaminase